MWTVIPIATFFLIPAFAFTISLFLFIPRSLVFSQKWQKEHHAESFSTAIFFWFASFSLLIFPFIVWLRILLHWETQIPNLLQVILLIVLISLTHKFFLPQILDSYKKWKSSKKPIHFSSMFFFGFFSLLSLSLIFLRLLISAASGATYVR